MFSFILSILWLEETADDEFWKTISRYCNARIYWTSV
jgi:hypothetical protein